MVLNARTSQSPPLRITQTVALEQGTRDAGDNSGEDGEQASAERNLDRVTALLALVSRHSSIIPLLAFFLLLFTGEWHALLVLWWCCRFLLTDQVCSALNALPESSDFGRLLLDCDSPHPPIDCLHGPPSPSLLWPSLLIIHRFRIKRGCQALPFHTVVFFGRHRLFMPRCTPEQ